MKTDKFTLDGHGFMSRPKTGSPSSYSKKYLTYLCQSNKCKTWMTSAGLCEQSSTSSKVPDPPIQDLLHCVSLQWALRFVLEETGDGRRGEERVIPFSIMGSSYSCDLILSTNEPPLHSQAFVCNILLSSLSQQPNYKNTFKEMINPKVKFNSVY